MPSRGSYQIASPEECKAARRDQSYRSCVATLLVFFMLCMVILIACVPWKKYSTSSYNKVEDKSVVMSHHHGNGFPHTEKTVTVPTTTTTTKTTTDASIEIFGEKYVPGKEGNQTFERYYESTTTTTIQESAKTNTLRSTSDSISTLSKDAGSTDSHDQNSTTASIMQSTQQPELHYVNTNDTTVSSNYEVSESTREENPSTTPLIAITEVTKEDTFKTEASSKASEFSGSTDSTPVSNNSLFDQQTSENSLHSTTKDLNYAETTTPLTSLFSLFSTTNSFTPFTTTDSTSSNNNFTDEFLTKINELPTTATSADYSTNTFTQETVVETNFTKEEATDNVTTMKTTTELNILAPTIIEPNTETCSSGYCKQVAAKMLSYMNHSADPCEDFYEYACGGMIADPQILDFNLGRKAYRRIAKQMRNDYGDAASLFVKYYNSCMQYENTISMKERIEIANKEINKIGKFYTKQNEVPSYNNFTRLYANLLLKYSPLLFDVAPDFDEYNPQSYTIRVGPILHENLFGSEDFCQEHETETQKPFVDLESIYKNYIECKQNKTRLVDSITKALEVLGVFNDSDDIQQNIGLTTINIDKEIIEEFFSQFPSENEIREAYLMKNYSIVSMEQLNGTTTLINWYDLMNFLTNDTFHNTKNVQVYFYPQLVKGLKRLEGFWKGNSMNFHNAILGLYAQKLYHDLVISKHEDTKQHCFQISINLLRPEVSNLYMSSLSNEKIAHKSETVRTFFNELKETLKSKIRTREWIKKDQRQILLTKIDDLRIIVPEISYFQYEKEDKLSLSDNYMLNTLSLMGRYRSSIYNVTQSVMNSDIPKQIWTHYATPFQAKALSIYGLNLVVIPFGAIDHNPTINDLTWATTGNLIARQISRHFDINGMHYWNKTRHIDHFLLSNNDNGNPIFENYINCEKNNIYKDQMHMTLPLTSQTISFKISGYSLNERLSEIMGLRLTYDTMERLKLFSNYNLPWLELNIKQLFYLNYAQMYCTKSLLTTSYVSLHENEELPSRIRVFVSASSDNLLGRSWSCPQGSQIVPSYTCDIFPYLDLKDFEISSA